jgi:hypothetical protein
MSGPGERRQERTTALEDLIYLRVPVRHAVKVLSTFGWDSPNELVMLTPSVALSALEGFEQGKINKTELMEWAEAIEGREDVGFDPSSKALLKKFIFNIANPELTEELSTELAQSWKLWLREASAHDSTGSSLDH